MRLTASNFLNEWLIMNKADKPPMELALSSYWDQYCFHFPMQTKDIVLDGHTFSCIGDYESKTNDIHPDLNSGFIFQQGRLSIVNPDPFAPISFVTVSSDLSYYSFHQRLEGGGGAK